MSTNRASNISRIRPLPAVLIDRIAAGEVIEGPYSVVKECMENSLDAHARSLKIHTEAAGMKNILVEDDGDGIPFADLEKAVLRHATSKIADLDDLDGILSYGFRGEALASIASVSRLEIRSRHFAEETGGLLCCRGGTLERAEPVAANQGTCLQIDDLFFSVPARRKYVKSERLENARIYREVIKAALAHPNVRFEYHRDGREFLLLAAHDSLFDRIAGIYESRLADHLLEVSAELESVKLSGFATDPGYYRSSRDAQFVFVNGRAVDLRHASFLVKKAYGELLPHGAQPCFFLFLSVDPGRVDVNVHPAKREVRLLDESVLSTLLLRAVHQALRPDGPMQLSGSMPADSTGVSTASLSLFFPGRRAAGPAHEAVGDEARSWALAGATDAQLVEADRQISAMPDITAMRQLGVVFGTYIVASAPDGLYLIDQHTAHERVNFERIRGRLEKARGQRQPLLTPVALDCSPDELAAVLERKADLEDSGFVIEEYGRSAYVVREVPTYLEPGEEKDAISRVIRRLLDGESVVRVYDEYAAMKACKASIKKNDVVSSGVLAGILEELAACADPARCPHGRPTMVRIGPSDLDRLFGRI